MLRPCDVCDDVRKICLYTYIIASQHETVMRCVESLMSILCRMRLIVMRVRIMRLTLLSYETYLYYYYF